jgi:hypothetical protein
MAAAQAPGRPENAGCADWQRPDLPGEKSCQILAIERAMGFFSMTFVQPNQATRRAVQSRQENLEKWISA